MYDAQTLRFEIDGMSCAGCAGRAERALTALPGLSGVAVNFANKTGQATLAGASLSDITNALDQAGYPAREASARLDVTGLSCASCVGRAEDALQNVQGVTNAVVNLASARAEVSYVAGVTDPADLARALTEAGYPAQPVDATTDDQSVRQAQEIAHARRMTLIALALSTPVVLAEMGSQLIPGLYDLIGSTIGHTGSWLMQFTLTTLVMIWPGRQFYRLGLPALARGAPDMNSLVALGTLAAWVFSTTALFAPALLPESARTVYFEAAAVIVTLILLGRWLEVRARGRTGAAIQRLIGLQPETARVERDGQVVERAISDVVIGDVLHVRPGERLAVDGDVIDGQSYVDEAMITGEPIPVAKGPGDPVTGGTINGEGALRFRATRVGSETVLARIIDMVERAQGAKLPVQALVDRVVRIFVPVVMAIALLAALIWLAFGPEPVLTHALVALISVLIIACPCAMGLATPTSIMVGTGRAAELGVLFRQGEALQRLDDVGVVAFDKTGTLTEGRPAVTSVALAEGFARDEVLALAAAAEAQSEHPAARAIEAAAEGLDRPVVETFNAITGFGLRARVDGRDLLIGAHRLMVREGIETGALDSEVAAMTAKAQTPIFAAIDGTLAAVLSIADPIRPGAAETVAALHRIGLKVAMISGDASATAAVIAQELGIDHVEAEVLPGAKAEAVAMLRNRYGPVAFVGDGINDAPALAEADTGLAVGSGTDVAIETADVVLISGDPAGVVNALDLSQRVMRNIRQNLFWAFAYNTALIPVAAGVLYPALGMMLSPMLAAAAMALSSVFVLTNALRLRGLRPALERSVKS